VSWPVHGTPPRSRGVMLTMKCKSGELVSAGEGRGRSAKPTQIRKSLENRVMMILLV
jgi:hypothetical protein